MVKKTIYRAEYRVLLTKLRELREDQGLSQTAVARSLGWSQQSFSAVEAGARRLDIIEFFELAQALGLDRQQAVELLLQV
ncbi:helix-turn-helix domain-containing protein [Lysobacter capsici]|uniref:helix-turn-helix domain-containing protein n=1 Tax=Lysobacter capsici TaxID=435897 RepID=UPI0006276089|nr:helix-turn-helix transcriptional regulator [Lysobacter capsici]